MSRQIERYRTRLLNVAKALRESQNPEAFDMDFYVHGDGWAPDSAESGFDCGTPACALGHYASRTDLQKTFKIVKERDLYTEAPKAELCLRDGSGAIYQEPEVGAHFGLDVGECEDLFGPLGCGGAKTPKAAAKFIEKFVKNRRDDEFIRALKSE